VVIADLCNRIDNRINLTRCFASVGDAATKGFDQLNAKVDEVFSFAATLPSMYSDIQSQRPMLDGLVANQAKESQKVQNIQQQLSQNLLVFMQHRQTSVSEFSALQSKLDGVRENLAHISDMSRQDQNTSDHILAAIQNLRLDIDDLKRGRSNSGNAFPDPAGRGASIPESEPQNNSRFEASFLRLLQLSKNSLSTARSINLKTIVKDLVAILDGMKTSMETGIAGRPLSNPESRCDTDDLERTRSIIQLTRRLESNKNKGW